MRIFGLVLTASIAVLSTLTLSAPARADDAICRQVAPGQIVCTEAVVYGRHHAPSSYYVLGRSEVRYEAPPLVRTDLPARVADTVRRAPF